MPHTYHLNSTREESSKAQRTQSCDMPNTLPLTYFLFFRWGDGNATFWAVTLKGELIVLRDFIKVLWF